MNNRNARCEFLDPDFARAQWEGGIECCVECGNGPRDEEWHYGERIGGKFYCGACVYELKEKK